MFASVQRRRSGGETEATVDVAPLIDMVFILLIFFLVTTTFVRDTGIEVQRPQASYSQALEAASLRISITSSGDLYSDGRQISFNQVDGLVREFVARGRDASVVLIADEATSSGLLVELMDAAKLAGAENLAIATRGRSDR